MWSAFVDDAEGEKVEVGHSGGDIDDVVATGGSGHR
jgi:hypothetical protein